MEKTKSILEKGLIGWKDLCLKPLYTMKYGFIHQIVCEFDALNRKNIWVRLSIKNIDEDSDGFIYNKDGFQRKTIIQGVHDSEFYCNFCNQVFHKSYASKQRKEGSNQCKSCFNRQKNERFHSDQATKSGDSLRQLTNRMLKGYQYICSKTGEKTGITKGRPGTKSHEIIGCTSEEFREYVNEQLQDGWTLQNYGEAWELDHIIPLSAFDLTDFEQLKKAGHYSNVRPLSILDNKKKYNKSED
jgi:hypothetical protein